MKVDCNHCDVKVKIIRPKHWHLAAKFELLEDVSYAGITAPAGFVTDGASIPRWTTAFGLLLVLIGGYYSFIPLVPIGAAFTMIPVFFPKTNRYFVAAVIHDYHLEKIGGSRKDADKIFKKCLIELGVKKWRIRWMYRAVRAFSITKEGF